MIKPSTSRSGKRGASREPGRAAALQADQVFARNQLLERSSLDSYAIRFPGLRVHAYFHYTLVEHNGYDIGAHGHWHWEITRVQSGEVDYSIQGYDPPVAPDFDHYLIIPPEVTHGWKTNAAPLLLNGWQITIEPEDEGGEQVLDTLKKSATDSGFKIKASAEQIQAEELLWQMAGNQSSWQLFAPVLCGFARIVIGDLLSAMNPWPAGYLDAQPDTYAATQRLAKRLKIFLDENLSLPITIKEMEAHFHYSGRHLNRAFQEVYASSIGRYIREQRMDLAKLWLSTTSRSVKDIALSLGYGDSSQFCRYFRKQTGVTPSQFRSDMSVNKHSPNLDPTLPI